MEPVNDPATLLQRKEKEAQEAKDKSERERLLTDLRRQIFLNPNSELSTKDILHVDVLSWSNEELKMAISNLNYARQNKISLLNAQNFVKGVNSIVEFYTEDQMTIEGAVSDKELHKDIEELTYTFFGEMPVVARIVLRLGSHLEYKKKQQQVANVETNQ